MSSKGIDVSTYQGQPNWASVKSSGVDFAFIRAGYGANNVDQRLAYNGTNAPAAGVDVHFYWFSYAYTKAMVIKEANYLIAQAKKYSSNCMLAWDFEYDSMTYANKKGVTVSKSTLTQWAIAFCQTVSAAGYTPVIYANEDYVRNYIDISSVISQTGAKLWFARYSSTIGSYGSNAYVWQYSSTGSVSGINGNVDMNIGYFTSASSTYTLTDFVKEVQSACGASVDGIAGTETLSKTVTVSATVNNRHAVVAPLQHRLNTLGYNCGTVDGIAGTKFTTAVNSYQKNVLGYSTLDGEITAQGKMWKSLLGML